MSKPGEPTIAETEGFALWCTLQGFDLAKFDAWLAAQEGAPVHAELSDRRKSAWLAILGKREQEALRHLEWMLARWGWVARTDVLSPPAKHGAKFPGGRQVGAVGDLTKAIAKHLKRHPQATAPEVWNALSAKPPKGFQFHDNAQGKYVERWDENGGHETKFSTFTNKVSQQRRALNRG